MQKQVIYYKTYLESLNKSPHTIKQYCIDSKQFLEFLEKNQQTLKQNPYQSILLYKNYINEKYSSSASINRKLSSLNHFLSFLKLRKVITDIPNDLLKPKKIYPQTLKTLTIKQIKMVISFWLQPYKNSEDIEYKWIALRNFCIVNLILELGLKPSEVVGMKWSHIDRNKIKIIQSNKNRTLYLSEMLIKWLNLYHQETNKLSTFDKEVEYIWLGLGNKQNESISVKTIERIFQTLSKQLNFKVTATILRYTTINQEVIKLHDVQLQNLFNQFGYSRKSVLNERIKRFN